MGSAANRRLIEILQQGAQEYDYLRGQTFGSETPESLADQVARLVEYLLHEKRISDEKYIKLLELHNNLVEESGKDSVRYSAEHIYRLADENDALRKELVSLRAEKLYPHPV